MSFNTSSNNSHDVTKLINELGSDGTEAYNKLFPLIYNELKDIASFQISSERNDLILNRTDLVHEVYIKWLNQEKLECNSRKHLLRLASSAMHQILVDYARKKIADKRGNGAVKIEYDDEYLNVEEAEQFLELNEACNELRIIDERLFEIVRLKYFSGLSVQQVADALNVSKSTINRDWKKAKTLLFMKLKELQSS